MMKILIFLAIAVSAAYCADLHCILGGKVACEIKCWTSTGAFKGHCDSNRTCVCEPKTNETKTQGDLACSITGNFGCRVQCFASGRLFGGNCDVNGKCQCLDKGRSVEPRNEYICIFTGSMGCQVNCILRGGQTGTCSKDKTCGCGRANKTHLLDFSKTETETNNTSLSSTETNNTSLFLNETSNTSLPSTETTDGVITAALTETSARNLQDHGIFACRLGGNVACSAFCFWTTGRMQGMCDVINNTCQCALYRSDSSIPTQMP